MQERILEPRAEQMPDLNKILEYEPNTERGWQVQYRSSAEVGNVIGDFSSKFEDLNTSLESKVQTGVISSDQRARILEQVSGLLNKYLSNTEKEANPGTQVTSEQSSLLTLHRLQEAGMLLGKCASALLEAPGKAIDKFFGGILRSGRKSLGELTAIGTETMGSMSSAIEDAASKLSKAGEDVASKGINIITEAIKKPGQAAIDTAGHAIQETLSKTGEGLGDMATHVSEGIGESYRVLANKASQGTAEAIGRVPTALGRGFVGGVLGK